VRTDLTSSRARPEFGLSIDGVRKQNLFGVIDGIAKALTAQLRSDA
jgi:hypothetical protein